MVFSSTIFLFFFLPLTLMGYYILPRKGRNTFLLLVSLFFYAWGEPNFILVMLFSIFMNYIFGLLVDKYRKIKNVSYLILTIMTIFNISVFFIYKYLDFAISNVNHFLGFNIPLSNIILPIGISFFTFQAMSYVIDVYREHGKVQKNPFNVALYITFFPQLIAGPIVRYETICDSIDGRKESLDDFAEGVKRFILGLSKKVILSNSLAIIADKAYGYSDYSQLSVGLSWLGAISYSLQILFDFSGYSDMAIGLGKMFGFHFNENFNYPYISRTISEFWRRWHISLGTWFRDYVYFPLGGSRVKKKSRLIFNLFIVWLLTGIWHGANWNYIIWGLFYFVLITFEKIFKVEAKLKNIVTKELYRGFTLLCILFGWVLFRANNINQAISYIKSMLSLNNNPLSDEVNLFLLRDNFIILVIAIIFCIPLTKLINKIIKKKSALFDYYNTLSTPIIYIVLFIIDIAYILNSSYNPFIYFNF